MISINQRLFKAGTCAKKKISLHYIPLPHTIRGEGKRADLVVRGERSAMKNTLQNTKKGGFVDNG
jgi:hypothetical protein